MKKKFVSFKKGCTFAALSQENLRKMIKTFFDVLKNKFCTTEYFKRVKR
jgi:hypothetical protein